MSDQTRSAQTQATAQDLAICLDAAAAELEAPDWMPPPLGYRQGQAALLREAAAVLRSPEVAWALRRLMEITQRRKDRR